MELSFSHLVLLFLLLLSFLHILQTGNSLSCHEDESSALLQFKQRFFNVSLSLQTPAAYSKLMSWNRSECCLWDGVQCDKETGHVIGLDLTCCFLHGSLDSNSSIFQLVHLQSLNLAYNDFNYSQIPSTVGRLLSLKSLNLSNSMFSGEIPEEISNLSELVSLDISNNHNRLSTEEDGDEGGLLKLEKSNLHGLIHKMAKLQDLLLSEVNISGQVPGVLANFSLLRNLFLKNCGLQGEFPATIFHLPKLQALNVVHNPNLSGYIPEFPQHSLLVSLKLYNTSFGGRLPDSIGNLGFLRITSLQNCNFSGSLPTSIGNLNQLVILDLESNYFSGQLPPSMANLSHLESLIIDDNEFHGEMPSWVGGLTSLSELDMNYNDLRGELPSSLQNLTKLTSFTGRNNQLSGEIPNWLSNMTQLIEIDLYENNFQGQFPVSSISALENLESLDMGLNNFRGSVDLNTFLELKHLSSLSLRGLSLFGTSVNKTNNVSLPNFVGLELSSCNLKEFPEFLQSQDRLSYLHMGQNKLQGKIPTWVWNRSIETLEFFALSNNYLTGFDQAPITIPWKRLLWFDLGSNMLVGSVPIIPPSLQFFSIPNNFLTEQLPDPLCLANSLVYLDMSNNNLSGKIPSCIDNSSKSLKILMLRDNNFNGILPQVFAKGNQLKWIELGHNQLQGKVPRSLANCMMLEFLDIGYNQIQDTFPSWLGALPNLKVLTLSTNKLYGAIPELMSGTWFPELHILDLSDNSFTGRLPSFEPWSGMKKQVKTDQGYYSMVITLSIALIPYISIPFSVGIIDKYSNRVHEKIPYEFAQINLSNNNFTSEISESIGDLKGLCSLNLSNNNLVGRIPISLENLENLESLDLSRNNLSGEIPRSLMQITFLEVINLSYNNLTGPIPWGPQSNTFSNNSYVGNPGLCGYPLSKSCGSSKEKALPSPEHDKGSSFLNEFDWIFISLGYGSGLAIGLVLGHILTTRNHDWFVQKFGRKKRRTHKRLRFLDYLKYYINTK